MSAWTKHVTQFYKAQHAKDPNYKFKNALKDAAKTYKSQGNASEPTESKPKRGKSAKKNKSRSRHTRKSRK